ncbi:hypothetical protein Tco_0879718 [Tanacetum coccineum]
MIVCGIWRDIMTRSVGVHLSVCLLVVYTKWSGHKRGQERGEVRVRAYLNSELGVVEGIACGWMLWFELMWCEDDADLVQQASPFSIFITSPPMDKSCDVHILLDVDLFVARWSMMVVVVVVEYHLALIPQYMIPKLKGAIFGRLWLRTQGRNTATRKVSESEGTCGNGREIAMSVWTSLALERISTLALGGRGREETGLTKYITNGTKLGIHNSQQVRVSTGRNRATFLGAGCGLGDDVWLGTVSVLLYTSVLVPLNVVLPWVRLYRRLLTKGKYVVAVSEFEGVSFPLLDELEGLKDFPLTLIMSALTLKDDHGNTDATLEFRQVQPSLDQVTMPIYSDSGSIDREMLLPDAIPFIHKSVERWGLCPPPSSTLGRASSFAHPHDSSLGVADYQVSTLVLSGDGGSADQSPVVQPHDDLFGTSILDKSGDS